MNIKRISIFSMLIIVSTVTLTICLPNSVAQDYTRINLPEGAKARLGKGAIFEIAYLPDGKRLTVGSSLGLWIYDAHSGEELALYSHQDSHQNNSQVISYSLSPDERTLASGGQDGTVRLWDVNTGTLKHTFTGHKGLVDSVSFSPDGKTIASGSRDRTLKHTFLGIVGFSVETGTLKYNFTGHNDPVTSVSFSPDGKTIASGSRDRTVRLWDVETGTLKHTFTGHNDLVDSVSFSPDGKTIASGSRDRTILLWDALTDAPVPEELTEDINGDGVVNIQDLVRVASRIGEDVPTGGDPADVNGDGVINIQDLVQVAGALGN